MLNKTYFNLTWCKVKTYAKSGAKRNMLHFTMYKVQFAIKINVITRFQVSENGRNFNSMTLSSSSGYVVGGGRRNEGKEEEVVSLGSKGWSRDDGPWWMTDTGEQ